MRRARLLPTVLVVAAIAGCGPREATLRIGMRSAEDRDHLVRGWSGFERKEPPEPEDFCWVEGTNAKVAIGPVPRRGTARVRIVAWPFSHAGLPQQRMALWVNALLIDAEPMRDGPGEYAWTFPARLFRPGENFLYLAFDRANRPKDLVPGSDDARELAAAVREIEVVVRR